MGDEVWEGGDPPNRTARATGGSTGARTGASDGDHREAHEKRVATNR